MTEPRSSGPAGPAPTTDARERVVAQLSAHFAEDRLTLPELERRVHLAYMTPSAAELEQLLADFRPHDPVGTALSFPEEARINTMLSSVERGFIAVPRRVVIRTFLGSTELDLTRATFAPGVTEIDVHAVLGSVEISLPFGVQVVSEGSPIVGSFAVKTGPHVGTSACTVRITGHAVLGSVDTWVVPPGGNAARRGD